MISMPHDTSLNASQASAPVTDWDLLRGGPGAAAPNMNLLARRYWRPVYRFIRASCGRGIEDAKDLTQGFFAEIFDEKFLRAADPKLGNFRRFLLTCVHNFVRNRDRAARTKRRGGGRTSIPLDGFKDDLPEPEDPGLTPEEVFNRAWAQGVLDRAAEELKGRYEAARKSAWYEAFRRFHIDKAEAASYAAIAKELGLKPHDIQNILRAARRDFRSLCRRIVQEGVLDPKDMEGEMDALFGGR